jgi:hypothetical protein
MTIVTQDDRADAASGHDDDRRPELPGVAALRSRRGDEWVRFREVADHLVDYAEGHAEATPVVDDIARFLARVESIPHDHDRDADHGM